MSGGPDGLLAVQLTREPAADLIPRFDGTTLRLTSKTARDTAPGGGLVAGPVLLDLGEAGRLVGVTVLEERRFWTKGSVPWSLPARATPHRLELTGAADRGPGAALPGGAEVRWDAGRRMCALLFAPADGSGDGEIVVDALGPRAYAAVADDVLVGLLADLRGFDRA